MKCVVDWCQAEGDPYFGCRCTDHTLEWLGTLSPAARDEALGPPMDFPKVVRELQDSRGFGNIFSDGGNGEAGVPGLREGVREQVAVEGPGEV